MTLAKFDQQGYTLSLQESGTGILENWTFVIDEEFERRGRPAAPAMTGNKIGIEQDADKKKLYTVYISKNIRKKTSWKRKQLQVAQRREVEKWRKTDRPTQTSSLIYVNKSRCRCSITTNDVVYTHMACVTQDRGAGARMRPNCITREHYIRADNILSPKYVRDKQIFKPWSSKEPLERCIRIW